MRGQLWYSENNPDVAPGDVGLSPLVAASSSLVGMVGSVRPDHRVVESPVSLGQHFGIAPLQSKPRADFNSAFQGSSPGDKSLHAAAARLGGFPHVFGTIFSSLKQSTDRVFRAPASVQTCGSFCALAPGSAASSDGPDGPAILPRLFSWCRCGAD